MKSLSDYIIESMARETLLNFENNEAAVLYLAEFEGQISDGKYENRKPSSHWHWVSKVKIAIDPENIGYKGELHKIKYSFKEWIKYLKTGKPDDYAWVDRCKSFYAAASLYTVAELNNKNFSYDMYVVEQMGSAIEKDENVTYDDFLKDVPNYVKDYTQKAIKAKSEKFFEDFKKNFVKVDNQDVIKAIESCCKTINTWI